MSTTVRRNAVKIFASVALVAGAATVAGIGTFGAYTDTTTADASVSSARVQVLMDGGDSGVAVNASDMVPGSKIVAPITITRGADSSQLDHLKVDTRITSVNALSDVLRLSVDSCSKAWSVSGSSLTCSGTQKSVAADVKVSDLASIGQVSTKSGPTSSWITSLNSGDAVYLRTTLSLPADAANPSSGLKTGIKWTLTGTLATGTTTVVTPTAS